MLHATVYLSRIPIFTIILLLVLNKATYSVLGLLIKFKNIKLLYCSYCCIIALLKQIYLKLFRI